MTCKVAAEVNRNGRFQIQGLGMDIAALLRFRDRANSAIRFAVRSVTGRATCELGRVAVPESEAGCGQLRGGIDAGRGKSTRRRPR